MGNIRLELSIRQLSDINLGLSVKCHLLGSEIDNQGTTSITFNGWQIINSDFLKEPTVDTTISEKSVKFSFPKTNVDQSFNLILSPKRENLENYNFNFKIPIIHKKIEHNIMDLYPFDTNKFKMKLKFSSENNFVSLSIKYELTTNLIAFGRYEFIGKEKREEGEIDIRGFQSQFIQQNEKQSEMVYTADFPRENESTNKIDEYFELNIRFKPFYVFEKSVKPIVYIYAIALLNLIVLKVSSITFNFMGMVVTISDYYVPFILLQYTINSIFFWRISKIQIGGDTRSLLQALKLLAWVFIGAIVVNTTFPRLIFNTLRFNIFDLILKFCQTWLMASALISLIVYSYTPDIRKRTQRIWMTILIFGFITLLYVFFVQTLAISEQLFLS